MISIIPQQKFCNLLSVDKKNPLEFLRGDNLWNYVLRDDSIEEVSSAMQENLGNSKLIKTFEYSINKKYVQKSIGK